MDSLMPWTAYCSKPDLSLSLYTSVIVLVLFLFSSEVTVSLHHVLFTPDRSLCLYHCETKLRLLSFSFCALKTDARHVRMLFIDVRGEWCVQGPGQGTSCSVACGHMQNDWWRQHLSLQWMTEQVNDNGLFGCYVVLLLLFVIPL